MVPNAINDDIGSKYSNDLTCRNGYISDIKIMIIA